MNSDALEKLFPKLARQLARADGAVYLNSTLISLKEMELLNEYLRNNTTVTKLNMSSSNIGNEDCRILAELLKENTTIKELDLGYNKIRADGMNALGLQLKHSKSVKLLSFRGIIRKDQADLMVDYHDCNPIVESVMNEIGLFLSSDECTIETLHLDKNLMNVGANLLGKSLAMNKHLTRLTLACVSLGDEGCEDVCEGLRNNSTLTHLDLSCNGIGAIGGKSLASVLASPTCALENLDISNNPIREGMNHIFESLIGNNKLRKLRMLKTGVSSACSKLFGDLIKNNKTLSDYYFHDVFGDDIITSIANALKENMTFKKLRLDNTGLTQIAYSKILKALCTNTKLTKLWLSSLQPDIELLVELMKKNSVLQKLMIAGTFMADSNKIIFFRNAARINYSICHMDIFVSVNGGTAEFMSDLKDGYIRNYCKRNLFFRNSDKNFEKTFVGHHLSTEFNASADIAVEFG